MKKPGRIGTSHTATHVKTDVRPGLDDESQHEMDMRSSQSEQSARRRRNLVIPIVVLLLFLFIGADALYWLLTKKTPVQYRQGTVMIGTISTNISAAGPVNANAVYPLNFSTTGQISEIDVKIGQHVHPGQVLAKLTVDKSALQDTIKQDQIALTGTQEALTAAQATLVDAQIALSNTQSQNTTAVHMAYDQEQSDLSTCNTSSTSTNSGAKSTPTPTQIAQCQQLAQDKYTQALNQATTSNAAAQTQVTLAQNQLTTTQNNLDKAKAQLQGAQDSLNSATTATVLTASASAMIAGITGVVGQTIGTFSTGNSSSAFITLVDTQQLMISAQVNEADIGTIQVGQAARFTLAAYPASTFRATVSSIEPIGQTSPHGVTFTVNLIVDPASFSSTQVYLGMTASITVTTAQHSNTLLLPVSALTFTRTALQAGEVDRNAITALTQSASASTNSSVVLVLKGDQLKPVLITTGLNNGQYVEVLAGLQAGDQVVVAQNGGSTTTTSGTRSSGG